MQFLSAFPICSKCSDQGLPAATVLESCVTINMLTKSIKYSFYSFYQKKSLTYPIMPKKKNPLNCFEIIVQNISILYFLVNKLYYVFFLFWPFLFPFTYKYFGVFFNNLIRTKPFLLPKALFYIFFN